VFRRTLRKCSLAFLASLLVIASGCLLNSHGNRKGSPPIVTRSVDVRHWNGKRVMLVGTARWNETSGSSIELRGGAVELPGYEWPREFIDRPAAITGLLLKAKKTTDGRAYRLGEIERAEQWSR
jgi:hypothetical protein